MSPDGAPIAVVDRIADLLHREIGLRPESSLRGRLERCVRSESAARGMAADTYLASLLRHEETFQNLLNGITVQESGFFRHPEHFELLARDIFPTLVQPVTMWSAGCANGQEAYSLAMLMVEHGVQGSVVATDLSTAALERTRAARYATREIAGLSTDRRARHLTAMGDGWEVNAALRARVRVFQHNLVDPLPTEVRSCGVIFCRNILIYLAPEHTRVFLDRLADVTAVGTPLFLGAAEVLWAQTERFEVVRVDGTFLYRRRDVAVRSTATTYDGHPAAGPARFAPPAAVGPAELGTRAFPATAAAPSSAAYSERGGTGKQARTSTSPIVSGRSSAYADEAAGRAARTADDQTAAQLSQAGQHATTLGDHRSAVVAFRACVYLTPHDAIAQLHLGLALEATGDRSAARRAFGAAKRALLNTDPARIEAASEGYSMTELVRLLDAKHLAGSP